MSKYISSTQTADSLPYDNTISGLSAETAKSAIDELNSEKLDKSDNILINPQVVRVKITNAGNNEFTDLALAVASITDADPDTKPYIIELGAGNFSVNNPIVLPAGVSLRGEGINSTSISPIDPNEHLIVLGTLSEVAFLNLKGIVGSIGSGKSAIYAEDVGDFGQIHKVSIYDFDIPIDNYANLSNSSVYLEYVDINGDYTIGSRTRSNTGMLANSQLENFYSYASSGASPIHIYASGPDSTIVLNSAGLSGAVDNRGIVVSNGANVSVSDTLVKNFLGLTGSGFLSENTGAGPSLDLSGTTFANNTLDISIDNPNTTGALNVTADKTKVVVDPLAAVTIFVADTESGGISFTGELNYSSSDFSKIADIGPLVSTSSTMGVFSGGQLSVSSGLTLDVATLKGYITTGTPPTDLIKYFQLNAQTILITANSNNYIYINSSGVLVQNPATPNTTENILLGRVVTNATDIIFIEKAPLDSQHYSNKIDKVFREAIGSLYSEGSLVFENGVRGLDVTSGQYYYSETQFLPSGGTNISFDSFYESSTPGIYNRTTGVSVVDKDFYDDGSGTLASIPSGKYAKHLLLLLGGPGEKYILVYAKAFYDTLAEVQSAPLPVVPGYMMGAFVRVASLIVEPSTTNIVDIIDERPRVGFASSSSVGGITSHGALSGLGANDHNQYLLRDGSNVMINDLDLGTNDIINIGLVDGVDISSHASRHLPNGLDPLTTTSAVTIGTTNSIGVANSLARADHGHDHGSQTTPTHHAVATTVANGFMSSADKTKLDGISGTRIFKSGTVAAGSFTGAPRTATVTFGTAMPNTNYSISVLGVNSRSWNFQSKTINGFVINSNSISALSGEVTWQCISHGETVE